MSPGKPLILFDPHPRTEAMVFTGDVAEELAREARLVTHFGARAPDDLVESVLGEVAIIVGQTAMPKERLERAPNLKAIVNVKANWEPNIDYAEAQRRGIHVLSAAPAMAPAVAEYCLCQAIALARGLPAADRRFREGGEQYGIAGNGAAYSLFDAPVGLIGYGNLGRTLVPLLRPFTRRISVHDPWLSDRFLETQNVRPVGLDAVLSESRFLFILAGVTSENEGFLDEAKLALIPGDASVVLASRAEVVAFDGFVDMASKGRFRAAIDVFPQEPVADGDPMRRAGNILFSAHLAGGLEASYARIRDMMLDDVKLILRGLPPQRLQRAEPSQAAMARSR
ncbi:NAD(P)-dependent oxidoreductase [Nitratireductor sp. XY-223]|uniref:NAD(P)-dependent oxidoreductase n=1 Tax=Nitratireductor sp. XY-223 TaxID=2561926 RepID=UPI0010AAAE2F|nr:NAD(P)-dependent oxidoreductase [Nitratireductor sp. XY-223]